MMVFADTYALLAWLNPNDNGHAAVAEYLKGFTGKLLTTEWVLMEVADALALPPNREKAVAFLNKVRNDPSFEVVGYDAEVHSAGQALYAARQDKGWSLTDCISFVVMKRRALTDALTEDKHFTQAGFLAVFGKGGANAAQ